MAQQNYTFEGWLGKSPESVNGKMEWGPFEPKTFEETDVDIQISHSGICGSDIHTLRSGWFPTDYPCCVGHEIVGKAVRVGSKAERGIKVGDTVGVGAQSGSCLRPDCWECENHLEQHCTNGMTQTYNGKWPNGDKSYGGYATYWRGHSHFVFKIPDGVDLASAAPMLCGGITMFSPLINNQCGPGKKVAIVGLGGLGHFGVLFAKALGADKVTAISRKKEKADDALKLGADEYIATDEEDDWEKKHASSVDLIVSTVSSPKMPLSKYLALLKTKGQFIQVGAPEDSIPPFNAFALITKGAKLGGSAIGSPDEIEQMLKLAADQKVKAWTQQRPMKEANQAVVDMDAGKARFRYVLTN